jgi:ATP diphosphatase
VSDLSALLEVMARLRDPDKGCPWDREQDFSSIAPYTIEEAYEVADAIERNDMDGLREELGDLLFQVAFHARMAEEAREFDFADVVETIVEKMIRRHPHVFADDEVADAEAQSIAWEVHKTTERALKDKQPDESALAGVALGLPALVRAQKLQKRAARTGFDWQGVEGVIGKVKEELGELEQALASGKSSMIGEELGDLLFSCVNLSRHTGIDAEAALRDANAKFERRFRQMESELKDRGRWEAADLVEMDRVWDEVKRKP